MTAQGAWEPRDNTSYYIQQHVEESQAVAHLTAAQEATNRMALSFNDYELLK